jgi:hypothetical protein
VVAPYLKVPGKEQRWVFLGQEHLNGMKGKGSQVVAANMSAALIKRIRMAQELSAVVGVSAQTLSPLVLPVTDRFKAGVCYLRVVSETQIPTLDKGSFSKFVQEETDKVIRQVRSSMGEAGFKDIDLVPLNKKCNVEDDEAGGVTALIVFAMATQTSAEDHIGFNVLLKSPNEKRMALVRKEGEGGSTINWSQDDAASIIAATVREIKAAQSRASPPAEKKE